MSGRLTRDAYAKLVDENLEWLLRQPRTLERDHIAAILREAVRYEYDAEYERGIAEGERRERAAVVAWLRADAERGAKALDDHLVVALSTAAFLIERGEHEEGT